MYLYFIQIQQSFVYGLCHNYVCVIVKKSSFTLQLCEEKLATVSSSALMVSFLPLPLNISSIWNLFAHLGYGFRFYRESPGGSCMPSQEWCVSRTSLYYPLCPL